MKKKLFLALLTTLLLLLAASTALAVSFSDYTCTSCGNPCEAWFPLLVNGLDCHAPACFSCGIYVDDGLAHCTPVDGSATCVRAPRCSVCSYAMSSEYEPDPDAHSMGDWWYVNETQHYRQCQNGCGKEEYADHTGGTATCAEQAVCEGCSNHYGELSTEHGIMTDWGYYNSTQHYRYCLDCYNGHEFGNHTGGIATCASGPICTVCKEEYGEPLSTHNGPFGEWEKCTIDQHWRMCETCKEHEYGDHTGGTATCAATAVCSVCHENYGFRSSTHTGNLSYEYLSVHYHYVTCDVCNQTFADPHTGGTAACESGPICELCETAYGNSLGGHDWGEWESNGDGSHIRVCKNDATHTETADCSVGTATCASGPIPVPPSFNYFSMN